MQKIHAFGGLMKKKKKDTKWMKWRHLAVRNIAYCIVRPYVHFKYGIKIEKYKEQEKRPYLILLNHQTPFDQFFVGMTLRGVVYYMATEDIFSNGWISKVIKYLVAPIPIKKQTTDIRAILNCLKVAKEGGSICIAPEGNRTYSGRTEYMNPSIVSLARKLGMPILIYRIEGGYGSEPRWSDVVRKGSIRVFCARAVQPEEYASMTDEELFTIIRDTLYVDEAREDFEYKHKKLAEYLERAIYYCPYCGLSEFESHGDIIKCKKCGREIRYLPSKKLEGVGFDFPYEFIANWYDAQKDFMNSLDVTAYGSKVIYADRARISEVIVYDRKLPLCKNAEITLCGNRITARGEGVDLEFPFDEASAVTVLGKNKANIYHGGKIYQLKGSKRFNALKYVHIYHRYKNIAKGDKNEQFLGL
jgi:1-acyl-sn-glycerol-3-phosphate acyltransferase